MADSRPQITENTENVESLQSWQLVVRTEGEWVLVPSASPPSPPKTLPEDIIVYLFTFIPLEDHEVSDNLTLMLVCKAWNILVRRTRPLWTSINIPLDCYSDFSQIRERVKASIKYSQNAMLYITIQIDNLVDLDEEEEDEEEETTDPSTTGERLFRDYIDIMHVLRGDDGCNAWQWRAFHLWLASGIDDRAALYILRCLTVEMPNLQELSVHLGFSPNAEIGWDTNQLLDIMPNLTALQNLSTDHRIFLSLHSFRPSFIVELTLIDTPAVREFFSIGSHFTALQRLAVDLHDRNVISGHDVVLPMLKHLKVSGWLTMEFISHLEAEKLSHLDIADVDLTASHLVGSQSYPPVVKFSWRSRDPTMVNARDCFYIPVLAFIFAQCSALAEINIWKKHQEVFEKAIDKARREGRVLKQLKTLKIYSSGWEFNDETRVATVDMSNDGD
ncbi:hypothetical protein M408DRAFT_328558 [Serendipita vermifera MAFF 305830]|uniref:F-box domain-containing protein n=1 Tax=Serendipita vermifera MAFF 305830 TaxID=933852 RepID=A0A0C3BC73_SERVB|nr:hypothetical protein M408DRAFT_328558 [Serendipita vermifera MAFF 305830]